MTFVQLFRAIVNGETIYFDGDGMLYRKCHERSHYMPIGEFVYYTYGEQPLKMLTPCMAVVGAEEYKIEYEIKDDENKNLKGAKRKW